ncbi:hypothetical protein BJX76DRAFT_357879 [Aspergillus varians]
MFGCEPAPKRPRHDRHSSSLDRICSTVAPTEPELEHTHPHPHPPAPSSSPHSTPNITTTADLFHSSPGSWYNDGFSQDPGFLASQEELRAILFTLANSATPTRASSPTLDSRRRELEFVSDESSATAVSRLYPYPRQHPGQQGREGSAPRLSSRRRIEYLKNYVAEIAPWLDMFDSHCTFRHQLPALSHSFPALLYAILAISARQMERKSGIQDRYDSAGSEDRRGLRGALLSGDDVCAGAGLASAFGGVCGTV